MKKTQLNAKTKRGLVLVQSLLLSAWDGESPLPAFQVQKWTKAKQSEFNQAMRWIDEQNPALNTTKETNDAEDVDKESGSRGSD